MPHNPSSILIYFSPGENRHAQPKKFCPEVDSSVFSGCSDILTAKDKKTNKNKKKDIGFWLFFNTVIFSMAVIKANTSIRLQ